MSSRRHDPYANEEYSELTERTLAARRAEKELEKADIIDNTCAITKDQND